MEPRKYQLQKQIIQALKANDNDLYLLLKSQWAHRFGVESLEELKNLDLNQVNEQPADQDNQKTNQSQNYFFEDDKAISIKDENNQEEQILNDANNEVKSMVVENKESFENTSYKILHKTNDENKAINSYRETNFPQPEVEALIPLPPKAKYSFLKKWLV